MPKTQTKYQKSWESDPEFKDWIAASTKPDGLTRAFCRWCASDFSIAHGGKKDVTSHMNCKKHQDILKSRSTTRPTIECMGEIFCNFSIIRMNFLLIDLIFSSK